jgi:hypothetical protein
MKKKLTVNIDGKLDLKFRETVFKKKGMRKGNITNALEEAMLMWINTANTEDAKKKNNVYIHKS